MCLICDGKVIAQREDVAEALRMSVPRDKFAWRNPTCFQQWWFAFGFPLFEVESTDAGDFGFDAQVRLWHAVWNAC